MVHTSKAAALSTHAAHRDPCAAAIYPAVFLIFYCAKSSTFIIFLRCFHPERDASVALALGHVGGVGGGGCTLSPPCFRFKTTLFYSGNYAQSTPLSGQMGGEHLHLRHRAAANAETMWLWSIIIIHSTSEATWKVAQRARLLSLHHGVRAGFAGASLCGNETAGSIIRSDGKSLCKVFCIITYQSQNSHPQILWVTKHQQLPHYCPPKSIPTNDKHRKREERKKILCFV